MEKYVFTINTSGDGPMFMAFSNVKALFTCLEKDFAEYKKETITYNGPKYNYRNLSKAVRELSRGCIRIVCAENSSLEIIVNRLYSKY